MLGRDSLALLILVHNEREPRGYLMDLSSFMPICDTGEDYALGDSDSLQFMLEAVPVRVDIRTWSFASTSALP